MQFTENRQWMFEILNTALVKLSRHISKVRRDTEILEKAVQRAKEEKGDDDEMEGRQTKDELDLENQSRKLEELVDFQKNLFLDVLHVRFIFSCNLYSRNSQSYWLSTWKAAPVSTKSSEMPIIHGWRDVSTKFSSL